MMPRLASLAVKFLPPYGRQKFHKTGLHRVPVPCGNPRSFPERSEEKECLTHDVSAVSETVGFILILAIILLAISVVYASAVPLMASSQETQYLKNVENAMVVLAYNANRIALGSAPSQSVEVKIREASLSFLGKSTFNVSWTNATGQFNSATSTLLTVEHQLRNQRLAYEGGGIWGDFGTGSTVVISRPRPRFSLGNTTTLPIVAMSGANSSIGGTSVVDVEMSHTCRVNGQCANTMTEADNVTDVTVKISSDYCRGWLSYFVNDLGFTNSSTHFDDNDCSDKVLTANITKFLGAPRNITLFLLSPAVEGKVQ